jgi:dUTP pyrophosphatase
MAENQLTIKFKRLVPHAQEPEYATESAAGLDLYATDYNYDRENKFHEYGIGIAVEIPVGYEGQIRPRSSISKTSLLLCNPPGTIDSDYRGELIVRFKAIDDREVIYAVGDRIAQLVIKPVPRVKLVEVDELTDTKRSSGGFGSTGK